LTIVLPIQLAIDNSTESAGRGRQQWQNQIFGDLDPRIIRKTRKAAMNITRMYSIPQLFEADSISRSAGATVISSGRKPPIRHNANFTTVRCAKISRIFVLQQDKYIL
jgi:hypothetical protein